MKETTWVKTQIEKLQKELNKINPNLKVTDGKRLPYAYEVISYKEDDSIEQLKPMRYETDILIYEVESNGNWKPRIIIECKVVSITTHDAITYSRKAKSHKSIHPYLRYGILIGKRETYPLPGRLFRHGENFDFMLSFKDYASDSMEWNSFIRILKKEIEASKLLEEIIFNSRSSNRDRYTVLHRPLLLE